MSQTACTIRLSGVVDLLHPFPPRKRCFPVYGELLHEFGFFLYLSGLTFPCPSFINTGGPDTVPTHIPIFAAAQCLARQGTEMMQRCIDLGGDINHQWSLVTPGAGPEMDNTVTSVRRVTPAEVFIGTFPSGKLTDVQYQDMCAGLDWMILQGAVF